MTINASKLLPLGPFLLSISVLFVVIFFLTCLFGSVRQINLSWLLVSFCAHVNIVHCIVKHRLTIKTKHKIKTNNTHKRSIMSLQDIYQSVWKLYSNTM